MKKLMYGTVKCIDDFYENREGSPTFFEEIEKHFNECEASNIECPFSYRNGHYKVLYINKEGKMFETIYDRSYKGSYYRFQMSIDKKIYEIYTCSNNGSIGIDISKAKHKQIIGIGILRNEPIGFTFEDTFKFIKKYKSDINSIDNCYFTIKVHIPLKSIIMVDKWGKFNPFSREPKLSISDDLSFTPNFEYPYSFGPTDDSDWMDRYFSIMFTSYSLYKIRRYIRSILTRFTRIASFDMGDFDTDLLLGFSQTTNLHFREYELMEYWGESAEYKALLESIDKQLIKDIGEYYDRNYKPTISKNSSIKQQNEFEYWRENF